MVKLIIWNRNSPNFDANEFVRRNGTEQIEFSTKEDAIRYVLKQARNRDILKQAIENEDGSRLSDPQLLYLIVAMARNKQLS